VRYPILLGSVGITAALALPALHEGLFHPVSVPDPDRPGSDFLSRLHPQNASGRSATWETAPRNFSTFSLGQSIATFIGPSLAGFTIDALGFRPTFVALASISLVVVLLALAFPRMVPPRGEHHDERETRRAFDLLKESAFARAP